MKGLGPDGVEEEFAIAFSAGDGRVDDVDLRAADLLDAGADAVDGELTGGGIAHDAAFADALAAGFELGFDEDDGFDGRMSDGVGRVSDICPSGVRRVVEGFEDGWQDQRCGDEGSVNSQEGDAGREVA